MDNLKKKGTLALAWDFGGKFANLGVKFIISIFLTRLLEPEEFGLIAMVNVIVGLSMIFTNMGLTSSLIQRKHLLAIHYNSVFYFNIAVASLLTLLLFFSSNIVANFYSRPELINISKVLSFIFIINASVTVQNTILRKELKNEVLTKSRFVAAIVSGVIGIFLAYYGFGVWSLVYQTLLNGIFYAIIIWVLSNWKPMLQFSMKALRQLWGFGFRIFISGLLNNIYTKLDVLFIGKLFSPELLGFFQRAKSLNQMVVTFSSGSLMTVLFPVLSSVQNDNIRFKNIVDKGFKVINWGVFLMIGLLFLASRDIYIILFTEKWLPSLPFFRILLATVFVYPLSALLVNVLGSKGNSKAFLRLEIIKKVLATFSFIAFFIGGIWGFLYTQAIVSIVSLFINMFYASKEIKVKILFFTNPFIKNLILMLIIVIPIFYFIQLDNVYLHFITVTILFTSIYILTSYLIKISGFELLKIELQSRKKIKSNYA